MDKIEVGQLFKKDVTKYPEGARFDITDGGCNLCIYFSNPSDSEIKNIKEDRFKAGYYAEENAIFMLFKFGNLPWIDAPYSVHLSKSLTGFQLFDGWEGLALNIYLVDAATGILKAMRLIGLKTRFSIHIIDAVEKQKKMSFENYDINVRSIMSKYSTKDLVKYGTMMM